MKGKLEDGTPVDIEKPGVILQDGKWWEFVEFRKAEVGETIYDDKCCQTNLLRMASGHTVSEYWIASEIPRATPEQLKAIGMKERDERPVACLPGLAVWNRLYRDVTVHDTDLLGKYRFVLVPDVQEEVHISCEGCANWIPCFNEGRCLNCFDRTRTASHVRKNYTPKPPQTEEPRNTCAVCLNKLAGDIFVYLSDYDNRDVFHTEKFIKNWNPPRPEEPRFTAAEEKEAGMTTANEAKRNEDTVVEPKVQLDFMVVPELLATLAFVPESVRCKIVDAEAIFLIGILGESGRKLVAAGIEFYFTRPLADKLISKGIAVESNRRGLSNGKIY
jgi:hypothetical protein